MNSEGKSIIFNKAEYDKLNLNEKEKFPFYCPDNASNLCTMKSESFGLCKNIPEDCDDNKYNGENIYAIYDTSNPERIDRLEFGKKYKYEFSMYVWSDLMKDKLILNYKNIYNKSKEYILSKGSDSYSSIINVSLRTYDRALLRNKDFTKIYANSILYGVAKSGAFKFFESIYKDNLDVNFNKCGPNKESILIIAAKNNNFKFVNDVLKKRKSKSLTGGTNIKLKVKDTKTGESVLHFVAKQNKNADSINVLKAYIKEVKKHFSGGYKEYLDIKDKEGNSAFHIAAKHGNIDFIITALDSCVTKAYFYGSYDIKDIANLHSKNKQNQTVYDLLLSHKNIVKKLELIKANGKSRAVDTLLENLVKLKKVKFEKGAEDFVLVKFKK